MRWRFSSILIRSIDPRSVKETTSYKRWSCRSYYSDRDLFSRTSSKKTNHRNQGLFFRSSSTFIFSSNQHYAPFSTLRNEHENINLLQVEIISKEFIKPTTPTPPTSRIYEVSIFDQLYPNFYLPFVYFYPNNEENDADTINRNVLIMERRQLLKQSLSETLTKFYPFAGRLKDNRHIDCNDHGVYYIEAKVNDLLSDFLKNPKYKSIHGLLPVHPDSTELTSLTDIAMVQATLFSCGGIAICLYASHKFLDGYSIITFMKAWATTARGYPENICPSFIAPSIFPSNPALPAELSTIAPMYSECKMANRRFVFSGPSLVTLKEKAGSSRLMGVIGLLFKCIITASKARLEYSTGKSKYISLTTTVNLRERSSPPMPPYCIGNMSWANAPILFSAVEDLGLDSIVQRLKNSISDVNADLVEQMKGEEFWLNMKKPVNELNEKAKYIPMTSLCNSGTYDVNFGWGKPIWVCFGLADTERPPLENFIMLMDTRSGNGIEALVILPEEDMIIVERNPELLCLASLNPSPLEYVD